MKRQKLNNAVGKKGKSGRKSAVEELARNLVIKKAWDRIKNKFDKKNKTPEDEKFLDIAALEIAKKTIPQKIEGNLTLGLQEILDLCEN